jgi:hypothetical protein
MKGMDSTPRQREHTQDHDGIRNSSEEQQRDNLSLPRHSATTAVIEGDPVGVPVNLNVKNLIKVQPRTLEELKQLQQAVTQEKSGNPEAAQKLRTIAQEHELAARSLMKAFVIYTNGPLKKIKGEALCLHWEGNASITAAEELTKATEEKSQETKERHLLAASQYQQAREFFSQAALVLIKGVKTVEDSNKVQTLFGEGRDLYNNTKELMNSNNDHNQDSNSDEEPTGLFSNCIIT